MDHLQSIRLLRAKSTEYNFPLFVAFVDNEKVFDFIELHAILDALHNARIDYTLV